MARIRSIHPSFFTDEACVSCSPLARLLYIGLWTDADDQGLFEWKPLQLKMRLLPGDNADAPSLLAELTKAGLVAEFSTGGKRFGAIRDFRTYQRPKKPNSVHVLPAEWRTFVGLDEAGSEPEDEEAGSISEPVPNQFPTGGEKPPQMEDGGEEEEGFALVVGGAAATTPAAPRTRSRKSYPPAFEEVWAAYPHHEGRSSKPKSLDQWRALPDEERLALPGAIVRFRPKVGSICGERGAPCMSRWLRDGKHLNFIAGNEASDIPLEKWRLMVGLWEQGEAWPDHLGPAPDKPGTRVPRQLLVNPAPTHLQGAA